MKLIKSFCIMVLVGLTFFSCSRPLCDLTIKHATYIYHNKTDRSVKIMVKNTKAHYEKETHYTILPQDSLSFYLSNAPIPSPFQEHNVVELTFVNENKCVTYTRAGRTFPTYGDGVFDLKLYRDFNHKEISKSDKYELHYEIDEKDYAKAIECQ